MTDMTFVNPYNFVPFPNEVFRRKGWGHVGPGEVTEGGWFAGEQPEPLYSGTIGLEWDLLTPLQLPHGVAGEWIEGDTLRIPGSSIKGVTRSVHEAMFNGCARIFDEGFVPGYRMPAVSWPPEQDAEWCLAQVVAAADGRPTRLRLTEEVTFVSAAKLERLMAWLPTTGDVVSLDLGAAEKSDFPMGFFRYELDPCSIGPASCRVDVEAAIADDAPSAAMTDPDACVFIVTDPVPRHEHPAWWAAARLTGEYHELSESDSAAWRGFTRSVAGSDDLRRALGGAFPQWRQAAQQVSVSHHGTTLGYRTCQTGRLYVGDVIWVRMAGEDDDLHIEEIRLSQIWRTPGGSITAGQRASQMTPCHPDDEGGGLCLSCATFGSIDARRKATSDGRSVGYRGHVRFSAAVAEGVATTTVNGAPLSSPKPGAGGFYLNGLSADQERTVGDIAAHWGSEADEAANRAGLRGRKYYWHGSPDDQHAHWSANGANQSRPRYRAAPQQPMPRHGVILVQPGDEANRTVLNGTVIFDRLPMPALQALLASLSPQRLAGVFEAHRNRLMAIHLGGGKPLGLGTAVPRVTGLAVTTTTGRYTGGQAEQVADLGVPMVKRLIGAVGKPYLSELLTLLDVNGLSGEEKQRLSYPPGAGWEQFGTKAFARSYGFFMARNGQQYENHSKPVTNLPPATAHDRRIDWRGKK